MRSIALVALGLVTSPSPKPVSADSFECLLAVSTNLAFTDHWYYTLDDEMRITASDEVFRHQYFEVFLFLTGFEVDEDSLADIRYDLLVSSPDGSVWYEDQDIVALEGEASPDYPQLAANGIQACFEPEDQFGTYTVRVEVRDTVGDSTTVLEETVELVEFELGPSFEDRDEYRAWQYDPALHESPERAVHGLLEFGGADGMDPGFFREMFESNTWLLESLLAELPDQDAATRARVFDVLSRCPSFQIELGENFSSSDKEVWSELREQVYDPLELPIRGREDLNELWGMFVAGRRIAPLYRLCLALAPDETGVVADTTVYSEKHDIDVPMSRVVPKYVRLMFERDLAYSESLTHAYLEGLVESGNLPDKALAELNALLTE